MPIERIFLDWERPCLQAAAEFLMARYSRNGALDLQGVTLVFPGRRAARRFTEIIVALAEAAALRYVPPRRTATAGGLPELLVTSAAPLASLTDQRFAWLQALRRHDTAELQALLPHPPEWEDLGGWLSIACELQELHQELAAAALNFRTVKEKGAAASEFFNEERWDVLANLQEEYLAILAGAGRADKHQQRITALEERGAAVACHQHLILIATADLPFVTRRLLLLISEPVTALIHAPASHGGGFDEFGCIRTDYWSQQPLDVPPAALHVTAGPAEQAASAVACLERLNARYTAEDITIGIGDNTATPHLLQHLLQAGLPARAAQGMPLPETPPLRLLQSASRYLATGLFYDFATLIRNESMQDWLHLERAGSVPSNLLAVLDEYYAQHLPAVVDVQELHGTPLFEILDAAEKLMRDLRGGPRPAAEWAPRIAGFLSRVFSQPLDRYDAGGRLIIESCELLRDILAELSSVPPELQLELDAVSVLQLVVSAVAAESLPPQPLEAAIELLGWLELQLDDAPVLIITGFNDGRVPQAINAHPFLPNALRTALGLVDNERRYARDAYALAAILASRELVHVILGRKDQRGELLSPSRLLFACDNRTLARRLLSFYSEQQETSRPPLQGSVAGQRLAALPRPVKLREAPDRISASAFRDYLACPYRYYLAHILHLQPLDDAAPEMDGALFGTIAHAVLHCFGLSPCAGSTDRDEIAAWLDRELTRQCRARFGASTLPAVLMQIEQLRGRLRYFAGCQAERRRQGWEIRAVEQEVRAGRVALDFGAGRVWLTGCIDRLDYHPAARRWAVLDYKTSDQLKSASECLTRTGWQDLQLPAYRFMLRALGYEGEMDVGYVSLGPDCGSEPFDIAAWNNHDYDQAEEDMRQIARKIHEQEFWPPRDVKFDPFRAVCAAGLPLDPVEEELE